MSKARYRRRPALVCCAVLLSVCAAAFASGPPTSEDLAVTDAPPGRMGGGLSVALRSEPKTLNPVLAEDDPSRDVIRCLNADLIHINRETLKTEPALATSWAISPDGKQYLVHLRHGVRFSDGQPFNADDVVFSFELYLDEKLHSPQRDLLVVGDKPMAVQKVDDYTVRFSLTEPYAAAERLFDGLAILPRHSLEGAYREGKFPEAWSVSASPDQFAGLGPFRLKQYVPGQRVVLEKNPFYWKQDKAGNRLPYLAQLQFLFVANEDAQVIRFEDGDTDVLSRFSAENFAVLEKQQATKGYHVADLGAGLEYNFLFFNLNNLSGKAKPEISAKQAWFNDLRFRQAVSIAIDRAGIVRLVYSGRATPLWDQVTPGNKLWVNQDIPHPARSLDQAKGLLKSAGFGWKADGSLVDPHGTPVEFTIVTNASNVQRTKMAAIIEDDLGHLGMNVHVVPLEFRAMVDRLLNTYDYEAAIMGIASGDVDPTNEMNVWVSDGETHLWNLAGKPSTPWEAEMDKLMQQQEVTLDFAKRKKLYDRVQEIVSQNLPVICLASPNILVAARDRVGNFRPAILDPYVLWNVEELYLR
ncbi:MAG TPA: ABC transporter substrate-binding protein [Candidatus Acidoferrum sp.]|jgi:peptide/nickel transport system substrate-binding protein|nr:ABC transporter substrate-binding protein [Candidatus Acidoferrum sp.]